MDTQYSNYDSQVAPNVSNVAYPFAKAATKTQDNCKLIKSNNIQTNHQYRQYVMVKTPYIIERNTGGKIETI
jgi:hypothetical protein